MKKDKQNVNATDPAEDVTAAPVQSEDTSTNDEVAQLKELVAVTQDQLKTALADYQNMLKQVEQQKAFTADLIKKAVFSDLIDLFTDLAMGMDQLPAELRENPHVSGFTGIILKYRDLLNKHGVTELLFAEGDQYDPGKAEVVGMLVDESKAGKVAQTVQPGYAINNVLIKPARVIIFRK